MELAVILEIINVILLLSLLYVYIKTYKDIKLDFTLGLILFALLLLLQNAAALYFHIMMVDYYSSAVMSQAMIITGLQTLGLVILNYITWKN